MVLKAVIFLIVASFIGANAQNNCAGSFVSYRDIISCAEALSPEIQRATLDVERAKNQVGAAGQWRNPEFSVDSVYGSKASEQVSETGLSLGVPIELGGKISARTAVSEGELAKAEATLFEIQAKVRNITYLKLHRLRHLLHEQEVIEESIGTFSKLVSQFSKRLKLSPEQEISVAVFKMSKSDYDLKKVEILSELNSLESYFQVSIGASTNSLKGNLPQSPKSWPKIDSSFSPGSSPKLKLAQADVLTAQAGLSLAHSESWPTLIVGPSIKIQNESSGSSQLYGFNLSLPLPIFNTNGPGRAVAAASVKLAETSKSLTLKEQEKSREEFLGTYQQSVSVLSSTLSHDEIEKKHATIERLFFQGIVPSSLVIEAHRTFVELEKSRNERELKALEALLTIYTFDGKRLELAQ